MVPSFQITIHQGSKRCKAGYTTRERAYQNNRNNRKKLLIPQLDDYGLDPAPPPPRPPMPMAEQARIKADEERLAAEEARRQADEERLAAEESRRKAEEAVRLADMQRTVRAAVRARAEKDELAKIAAQALAEAATEKRKREEMEAQIVLCTICQDKKAVYVGVACAHLLFCQDCKDEGLEGVNGKCPICRGHIPAILKVMV
mmetsp:Transcript_43898/g.78879  ORF Transcript_43898/g.78879 Transcript_43898/m.78879 type:complete len:202 (+) Transcript_43898:3-608(+)